VLTRAAPAHEAVFYEETTFQENSQEHGPFSGYPRDEIDQNWHNLLNGAQKGRWAGLALANVLVAENIVVEPEVMRHYGREDLGVALPEGGGYIGTLNVYHELHCIVSAGILWLWLCVLTSSRNGFTSTATKNITGKT
jgi:Mycotoxin biosynthesis protein UstYa